MTEVGGNDNDDKNNNNNTEDPSTTVDDPIDDLRQRGNYEFSNNNYDSAIIFYSQALALCDNDKNKKQQKLLNLCNRSACYYCMEKYEESNADAKMAWDIENSITNIKAAYRLAKTQLVLGQYNNAQQTLNIALKILPKGPSTKKEDKDKEVTTTKKEEEEEDDKQQQEEEKSNEKETEKEVVVVDEKLLKTRKAFEDLLIQAYVGPTQKEPIKPNSIKWQQRLLSIREFTKGIELGFGNFSEIYQVTHKKTNEKFALKCIVKKKVEELAKRQHPNVHNEVEMERRVLMERIPPLNSFIVKMYHSFEDYNTVYYLMDLHEDCGDLWSKMRYDKKKMCGCYNSQIQIWMLQLIDAIEYIHSHGIVHRDLKPENILLNKYGDIIVIDFGTAKDLIQTDLNGPEFVGTPDFMSPEAVQGTGAMPQFDMHMKTASTGANCSADLWALGAIAYILHTGQTPFWSQSPYLAFLKIKRCQLKRPWGIVDNECWDFISSLMQKMPNDRLCSNAYTIDETTKKVIKSNDGYNPLREHPYLTFGREQIQYNNKHTLIPSLQDLCIRKCADMILQDSTNVTICDKHPPGDLSKHDVTKLNQRERQLILHFLDKRKLLTGIEAIRLYERFFTDIISCRLNEKIRMGTHDYVGYGQMNDDMGKPPNALNEDPYAKPMKMDPLKIAHITNPLLSLTQQEQNELDEVTRKKYVKQFKKCIVTINRVRPKMVIVCGTINNTCRKLLIRISDSIPICINDSSSTLPNSTYYTIWHSGIQVMLIQSKDLLINENTTNKSKYNQSKQMMWIREYLEQCSMSKHPLFLFIDCDPRQLPNSLLKRIARGKIQALIGLCNANSADSFESKFWYKHKPSKKDDKKKKNKRRGGRNFDDSDSDDDDDDKDKDETTKEADNDNDNDNDDISVRSTDSKEDEKDDHCMKIMGSSENAIRWITMIEEDEDDDEGGNQQRHAGDWESEYMKIELPSK